MLRKLCRCRISCFVVTKGIPPAPELLSAAEARGIPVLTTPLESTPFIKLLSAFLEERLATRLHLHSVLLDVFGLGVLILGESGIGKSECALELIDRGHRLVADDVVEVKRMGDLLVGVSPDLTRYHMELRGLGVLNIKDLYGVSSMRLSKRIELVVQLERWDAGQGVRPARAARREVPDAGRRGAARAHAGRPGRNIALLVEVAARNQLLREGGYDAARRFVERVDELVAGRRAPQRPQARAPAAGARVTRGRAPPAQAAGDHGPLGLGQDPRLARARGRRLVLRRQPAAGARAVVRGAGAPLAGAAAHGARRRPARARLPGHVPGRVPRAAARRRARGVAGLPRGRRPHAAAALQRDAPAAPVLGPRAGGDRDPGGARGARRPIRRLADAILDTSRFTVHELRDYVRERYDTRAEARRMLVSVLSFGYKFGLPAEADLVFDARFLANPNFVPRLRRLTGRGRAGRRASCGASPTRSAS